MAYQEHERRLRDAKTVVIGYVGMDDALVVADGELVRITREHAFDQIEEFLLSLPGRLAIWDLRRIIHWPMRDDRVVLEVKSLLGGDKELAAAVRQALRERPDPLMSRFLDLDLLKDAHIRAAKTVGIPLVSDSFIPRWIRDAWIETRTPTVARLLDLAPSSDEYERRWPFIRALREMEFNGIHIDLPFIEQSLRKGLDVSDARALRSLQGLRNGELVVTLLNPMGGATGRVRHQGGFNSLAIPKGPARDAITSRYDGGQIYTFDFNAIDYRCIVRAVGGEVARLYEGARDFHERTASFIFRQVTEELRGAIKYLSYIYIYGGSDETLQAKTGWTMDQIHSATALLDRKIQPIQEFRVEICQQDAHGRAGSDLRYTAATRPAIYSASSVYF